MKFISSIKAAREIGVPESELAEYALCFLEKDIENLKNINVTAAH